MNYRQQYERENKNAIRAARAAIVSLLFAGVMFVVSGVLFLESENVFHGGHFSGWYAGIMEDVSFVYV